MIAAVGAAFRPAASRMRSRRSLCIRSVQPLACHLSAHQQAVPAGGKSAGSARHTGPLWVRWRIASTMSRMQRLAGLPPRPASHARAGSSGSQTAHSASLMSEG